MSVLRGISEHADSVLTSLADWLSDLQDWQFLLFLLALPVTAAPILVLLLAAAPVVSLRLRGSVR